ncbi:MAG: type II toxin-antitoxin system VapC family toxin [Planctomycetes bacterium]|nr:type II toxin-antitoxin system VapC family toxin [Planctomycetota bacterium]
MTALYADASAILRWLFAEKGERIPLTQGLVATSRLVEVETSRAVDRARLAGYLDDAGAARRHTELADLLAQLHLAAVSDDVIRLARATFPVNVRALDAIHVATAQVLAAEVGPLQFWTHDARQATAAMSRGLDVRGV